MNITLIHIVEAVVFLLFLGTLFQIRALYRQSVLNWQSLSKAQQKSRHRAMLMSSSKRTHSRRDIRQKTYAKLPEYTSNHALPLPEVSFVESLSVENTIRYKQACPRTKAVLNNYIDDMFFETSYEFVEDTTPLAYASKTESLDEPAFVLAAEENAKLVRALERLN